MKKEDIWQRIEYYEKRYPELSREEQQKMLEERLRKSKAKHPAKLEYWIINNPTLSEEECKHLHQQYIKENNYQYIEYWMKRFPEKTEDECMVMMKEHIEVGIKKRPDITGENNPAHRSKTTEKQRKERSIRCIEYYEKHYPELSHEEHLKMMEEKNKDMLQKASVAPQQTQTRYWIERGYTEEEAKEKVSERQRTFTLGKCIQKYGDEKGREIFEQRQEKWKVSLNKNFEKYGDGRAPQSQEAYFLMYNICKYFKTIVPIHEKYMTDPESGRHYSYDLVIGHKILEYNGDYWHCNPESYTADYFNKRKKMYADEIWMYDKQKINCAIKKGYQVIIIWESEYKKDPEGTLQKCIDFFND